MRLVPAITEARLRLGRARRAYCGPDGRRRLCGSTASKAYVFDGQIGQPLPLRRPLRRNRRDAGLVVDPRRRPRRATAADCPASPGTWPKSAFDDVAVHSLPPGEGLGWGRTPRRKHLRRLERLVSAPSPRPSQSLSAYQVGGCQAVYEVSVDYSRTRIQFGTPIGRFQRVQDQIINAGKPPRRRPLDNLRSSVEAGHGPRRRQQRQPGEGRSQRRATTRLATTPTKSTPASAA